MLDGFINDKWFEMLESFSYKHMVRYPEKWKQGYIDSWRVNYNEGLVQKFPENTLIVWELKKND